jgi:predicted Zn-dependent peptidase
MLDRTIAPSFNRTTSFDLIPAEKRILKGGAETYFVLGGTQDVCKIEIVLPAGRWNEKAWGAAYFTANLLSKGTQSRKSFEIAHLFDLYGAHLEVQAGLDHLSVSLYILNKNFEPAVSLLVELLTEPTFPEDEVDLLKSIYLQNLKVNHEKTSFLASRQLRRTLFGENHPYGKELDFQDVEGLSRATLKDHFVQCFKTGTLFVSGKVDKNQQKQIEEKFSFLSLNAIERNDFQNADASYQRNLITKEGSVQATVRMGKKSIARTHQRYAELQFLNHILGGYFGSRLMKNIREEKGLSYGISSSVQPLKHNSYFVIGADVNRENLDVTFDEVRYELKRLRTEPVDEEELNIARNHFIGGLQLEITTSFAHADKVKNIVLYNLSPTHYQNMISRIDAITAAELLDVANDFFAEDSFAELAVG